jgi:hypothetical protein
MTPSTTNDEAKKRVNPTATNGWRIAVLINLYYFASMCHSENMVANIYTIRKSYWTLVNLLIWGIRFSLTNLVCDDLVTYFVFDYRNRIIGLYVSSSQIWIFSLF